MTPRPQIQPHKCSCVGCVDRVLPANLRRFFPNVESYSGRQRALSPIGRSWLNGSTLQVRFLGGTELQRAIVKTQAGWWAAVANIKFSWDQSPQADIRISFNPADGAWSYIGTDCKSIPQDQPTCNLGFLDGGTAAHELGHCLSGDTLIDCPRDLEAYPVGIPIRDLVGQKPFVYAWKDGAVVIRKASRVWLSKHNAGTVRVKLGTGQGGKRNRLFLPPLELVGTPDHLVLLADGNTWKPMGDLRKGDRLCSLYRQKNGKRSRLHWTGGERIREHVFICEQVYGPRPEKHDAHHINVKMMDQRVENLEWKNEHDHLRDHSLGRRATEATRLKMSAANIGRKHSPEAKAKMSAWVRPPFSAERRAKLSAAKKGKPQSPELRAKRAEACRRFCANGGRSGMFGKTASPETRAKQSASLRAFHAAANHTVISVEPAGTQDVYDMTVPDADSFVANGVVVHNSLGLIHEHQSPNGGIQWNKEVVLRDLAGSPNFWDAATVAHNIFDKYATDQVNSTQFDPASVMLYSFPASWTLNGFSSKANDVLSEMDKSFISSAAMYPKDKPTISDATELLIDAPLRTKAEIGVFGEIDVFRFEVKTPARYLLDTFGWTDVLINLYGPDSETALIASDDDSGTYLNSKIVRDLVPGAYFLSVRHFNKVKGLGAYSVRVATV